MASLLAEFHFHRLKLIYISIAIPGLNLFYIDSLYLARSRPSVDIDGMSCFDHFVSFLRANIRLAPTAILPIDQFNTKVRHLQVANRWKPDV